MANHDEERLDRFKNDLSELCFNHGVIMRLEEDSDGLGIGMVLESIEYRRRGSKTVICDWYEMTSNKKKPRLVRIK